MSYLATLRTSMADLFSKVSPVEDQKFMFTYTINARNIHHAGSIILNMDGYMIYPDIDLKLPKPEIKWGMKVLNLENVKKTEVTKSSNNAIELRMVNVGTYSGSKLNMDIDNNHYYYRCSKGVLTLLTF